MPKWEGKKTKKHKHRERQRWQECKGGKMLRKKPMWKRSEAMREGDRRQEREVKGEKIQL